MLGWDESEDSQDYWSIRDTTWDTRRTHETGENWKAYERREHEEGFTQGGREDSSRSTYYNRGIAARNEHEADLEAQAHWLSCRQLKW